jgi:hypothetical protein
MTAPARIIWLDEEAPETFFSPVFTVHCHDIICAVYVSHEHDGAKSLEPVVGETINSEGFHHGISIAALYLAVQLVAQIHQQRAG